MLRSTLLAAVIPITSAAIAHGAVIAQYNMGNTSGTVVTTATTLDPNASATALTPGSTTVVSPDPAVSFYTGQPGPNMISVALPVSTGDDTGFSESFTVTANAGFVLDPTSFTLKGGAGGASNVRSAYIYDNVDGFPSAEHTPPFTGGTLLNGPSGTAFTVVRSTGGAIQTVTVPLTAADLNQTSFTITVWFDSQAQTGKNIDLGLFELDGTVAPLSTGTPEPASLSVLGIGAGLLMRRRRA